MAKKKEEFRINKQIISDKVRLVGDNITPGEYSTYEAIRMANDMMLDLVELNKGIIPICKIIDYGKFLYERKKKERDQMKKARESKQEIKEIRFGPNTDDHDFNFKEKQAINFIKKNDKVKAVVLFHGRELTYKDKGEIMLLKLAENLMDIAVVECMPKLEGKKMFLVLRPKK